MANRLTSRNIGQKFILKWNVVEGVTFNEIVGIMKDRLKRILTPALLSHFPVKNPEKDHRTNIDCRDNY